MSKVWVALLYFFREDAYRKMLHEKAKVYRRDLTGMTVADALTYAVLTTPYGVKLDPQQVAQRSGLQTSSATKSLAILKHKSLIRRGGTSSRVLYWAIR